LQGNVLDGLQPLYKEKSATRAGMDGSTKACLHGVSYIRAATLSAPLVKPNSMDQMRVLLIRIGRTVACKHFDACQKVTTQCFPSTKQLVTLFVEA